MSVTYEVTIERAANRFKITWLDMETNKKESFPGHCPISTQDIKTCWEDPNHRLGIGHLLFHFLDGDDRAFERALIRAEGKGELLHLNLRTCRETEDWPFELMATDDEFLILKSINLIRLVGDRGSTGGVPSRKHPLKILFMAALPLEMAGGINYVKEQEAVLRITEKLPIEMTIEDSGSIDGLGRRLAYHYYDIVHVTAHSLIDDKKEAFFCMQNDLGKIEWIYPEDFWKRALQNNPPRLLFLSGCRTGETRDSEEDVNTVSFARRMVEAFRIPAVLGWGRRVTDLQAGHAAGTIYFELSRGSSIPKAVQCARNRMEQAFPHHPKPAWPLLRLYGDRTPMTGMVKKELFAGANRRLIIRVKLADSGIKVPKEGFIGLRRHLHNCMRTFGETNDCVGVMLMGGAGLGKSCLAGKIFERLPDHTVIAVQGRLDAHTLKTALRKAFNIAGDKNGLKKLAPTTNMTDLLADLCCKNFKEKKYLLIWDQFDVNLEMTNSGEYQLPMNEVGDFLVTLLQYFPYCGKNSHLVITSRYNFSFHRREWDLLKERLQPVWLAGLDYVEQDLYFYYLENINRQKETLPIKKIMKKAGGNPFLMEKIDWIVGKWAQDGTKTVMHEIDKVLDDLSDRLGVYEKYQQCDDYLKRFLKELSGYRKPVSALQMPNIEKKTGVDQWQETVRRGMNISLVEYDDLTNTYDVTPLLRHKLDASGKKP